MLLAEVVIDIPTKQLEGSYTYEVPPSVADDGLEIGCSVCVPFGHRKAVGFVMDIYEGEGSAALKPLESKLTRSYFDRFGAQCARFLSQRYVAPLSVCMRLLTPPGAIPRMVRTQGGAWRLERPSVEAVDDRWLTLGDNASDFTPRKNAVKQKAVLEALERGGIKATELRFLLGDVSGALKALEAAGAIKIEHRRRVRGAYAGPSSNYEGTWAIPERLTEGQQQAIAVVKEAMDHQAGEVVLVDGITGSGKTEVYLQAIGHCLDRGQGAIMLVPEIALTPQTVARFRGRFGDAVAVLHSKMSPGERFDQWDVIRSGEARVVIGPRSALFAPLQNLGLIVIDEEHETTYKQESAPRYVSRDVASWMMKELGGTLVLGSATPSIEALHLCRTEPLWQRVSMPERVNNRPLPRIEIIDMAEDFRSGTRSLFSTRLKSTLRETLRQGQKAVLLLNQRGFARSLLCRDCGFVPKCTSCSTTLTYHETGHKLMCHHCGYTVGAPPTCPACGSPYLKKFGVGTQRVEAELRAFLDAEKSLLPMLPEEGKERSLFDIPIIRMDADTTKGKGSHQRLLETFAQSEAAVLLGTQMIAKGLDFDDVTLVGVINVDTQLNLPDFRSFERTFDLIEQVAGRAGRAELSGSVLVQTYEADNIAIRAAARYDRELFLRTELPKRKVLRYPPFVRMANVLLWGRSLPKVKAATKRIQQIIAALIEEQALEGWEVLDGSPCVFERIRNDLRWHVLVKCPPKQDISSLLAEASRRYEGVEGVNLAFDVDPMDLL